MAIIQRRQELLLSLLFVLQLVDCANNDLFNYGYTSYNDGRTSYGQPNWGSITCDDPSCTGFAEKYPFTPFDHDESLNNCRWCPESGDQSVCGLHRQSPVNLKRDRAIINGTNYKECPDWHYMQTRDDTCSFDDLVDGFSIERHALRLEIPQLPDGQIACEEFGQRLYPRLDYSKGFPNWWWMQRIEIMAPAQHTQEGTKYAAEVILQHFYEIDHYKNQLGHVSIFLQDYPGAESWAFLDKLICHWRIEEDKIRTQCGLAPATPYGRCQLFRNQTATPEWLQEEAGQIFDVEATRDPIWNHTQHPNATLAPTPPPTTLSPIAPKAPTNSIPIPVAPVAIRPVATFLVNPPVASVPSPVATIPWNVQVLSPVVEKTKEPTKPVPEPTEAPIVATNAPFISMDTIQCDAWDINFPRMCHSDEDCCGDERSDTAYCLDVYEELGGAIAAACFQCCEEPQSAGPMAPVRDDLPLTLKCADLDNVPNRMCQTDSCCSNPRSESDYCKDQYDKFSDNELEQICHYCCSTPMIVGPSSDDEKDEDEDESNDNNNRNRNLRSSVRVGSKSSSGQDDAHADTKPDGAKEFNIYGKKFLLSKENFDPIEEDEDEYFNRRYAEHKRRNLQQAHQVNYDDVEWDPYEWLFRVETEYYFRYEGTMLVPPCWEVVHWRNMKDPIVVHKRQIDEINRLLAFRLNPDNCARESAGILSPDGNRLISPRETQYMHDQHRFVFCECPDWPSKFTGDREWCHKHTEDVNYTRFYQHPYSFSESEGWTPAP